MKKVAYGSIPFLFAVGLLAGCGLFGAPAGSKAVLPPNNRIIQTTLSNGLQVVIVPSKLAPIATSVLTYRVGSAQAPSTAPGIAHALQHLIFAGGPGLTRGEEAAVARSIGGDLSAETTADLTRYIFTVPASDLKIALHLQAIGMEGMTRSSAAWPAVRQSLDSEIAADTTNPQYSLYARLRSELFRDSPYAHDALGTQAKLESVTAEDLKRFHDRWYLPNNAILVVAGDVDPNSALTDIRDLFGSIPAGTLPKGADAAPKPAAPVSLDLTDHLAYGAAAISLRLPGYESPDYPAALVLTQIIRNDPSGMGAFVSSGGAFGAGFSYDVYPKAGIGTMVAAYSPSQDGSSVKEQLKLLLAKYMNGGIASVAVDSAKLQTELMLELSLDSTDGLAVGWAQALSQGRTSPQELLSEVADVSTAEVNRVARRYIDLGQADFATMTPAKSGQTLPLASQGYGGVEPADFSGAPSAGLPTWAAAAEKTPSIPVQKPTDIRFANGLRLIVQPEENSSVVELYGLVNTNPYMEVPKGKEGVDEILGQLMSDGTSSMTKQRFQAALDRIGAEESAGSSFSLNALSSQFASGVSLLAQNLLHPSFKTSDFEEEQKLIGQIVDARSQNPSVQARAAFLKAVLPSSDPALRSATPASVKALTVADVKSYYRDVFRPDMTTIVVVGNVTPDDAKRVVERYFGGWRSEGSAPNMLLPHAVPNGAAEIAIKDPGSIVDQVRMAEAIPMVRSNPDYLALQVGNAILSGGQGAGLIGKELVRKHLSADYLSSTYVSGASRTFYLIDFADAPQSVRAAVSAIEGAIEAIQKSPPTQGELNAARNSLLQSLALSMSDYSAVGGGLLNRSRLGLPLDEPSREAAAYENMTAGEVTKAMAKWVRPSDFALVAQGPDLPSR
ncbi:MAG TPA: pitrilysin family protein [Spirochaetia bacterium]|nr:pitrilysin family protein [Spirochaetia bacterium]